MRLWALSFVLAAPLLGAPLAHLTDQAPIAIRSVAPGVVWVDFGAVAFGNLELEIPAGTGPLQIRLGEKLLDGRIDRRPPGTVRYSSIALDAPQAGKVVVAPPADARNTRPPAVLTPPEWGVVTPFRWVEIEGWPGEPLPSQIRRRAAFPDGWDDSAAAFHSSDPLLNRIWELGHYSIKATAFAGIYVDGDRERIAYEADAYLDQLGQYACNADPRLARATFDRLIQFPTWPTEWAAHDIFIAYADWMETGDRAWLAAHYAELKPKLLLDRARPDGLLTSTPAQIKKGDLVDWPQSERDGFVFTPVNSVVNAFELHALTLMVDLAHAVGREDDAAAYSARLKRASAAFQTAFFDPARGVFRDGETTAHASQHANLFPLAFHLITAAQRSTVVAYVKSKGMACSVYAAQYLLQGLFEHGAAGAALDLITAPGDRSWRHMIDSGTTLTWEAWDQHYKPNQDWNHAWGSAPVNVLPRYVLGARAQSPGWTSVSIHPQPGALTACSGTVPTPLGPMEIRWKKSSTFSLHFALPARMTAQLNLPATGESTVWVDGARVASRRQGDWVLVAERLPGTHDVEVK